MHLMPIVRTKSRQPGFAPLDCLIGMALLAGAALTILPVMAALSAFALIAAVSRSLAAKPRTLQLAAR